ncbi:hypothetical protein C8F04DRAFT_160669 [Mycena alexandri]|uniref:Uncharacterized protein n=1 Tax=Mycena alexandri TaxID=1745969 RepID=A0AAD6SAP5_9AGAR|nr:hypothetical protein C8F04DRAFT_160669 [Mycena alexandri]
MSESHLISTALLAFATNNILQYVLLSLVLFYSITLLFRPLLPSAKMSQLESLTAETLDIFQSANEERLLSKRDFNMEMQLRLSRVNLNKSVLRSTILQFELGYRAREYLHIVGALSGEIDRYKREVKAIQVAIQVSVFVWRNSINWIELSDRSGERTPKAAQCGH